VTVVEAAGGGARDIVRLTMYCCDRQTYLRELADVGAAYRRVMGRHYPSMSLLQVSALLEEGAQIEIEATAALSPTDGGIRSPVEAGR
jgi:enamine deaminase RidA (YjgF/YER057c/UK114 family)